MSRKLLNHDGSRLSHDGKMHYTSLAVEADYKNGLYIPRDSIHSLLQACLKKKDIASIRKVHTFMVAAGFGWIPVLGDHLIRLFSSLGCWLEASLVFSQITEPSVYTWNALMEAHSNSAKGEQTIVLFYEMQESVVNADEVSFLHILKACRSLNDTIRGMLVHHQIVCSVFEVQSIRIGNAIVSLYAKSGCVDEARRVFNKLPNKDVASWGAMFSGYSVHGQALSTFNLYEEMENQQVKPSREAFLSILKDCGKMEAVEEGRLIHDKLARTEFASDIGIGNTLVEMYVKCKCLTDAYKMFKELPFKDMFSWTALITKFCEEGCRDFAFELFDQLLQKRLNLNRGLCSYVLRSCECREKTDILYDKLIRNGYEQNIAVGCALVEVYGSFNLLQEARHIFDKLNCDGSLTWSKIISSCTVLYLSNLIFCEKIQLGKILLDHILNTCSQNAALKHGQFLHDLILKSDLAFDTHLNYRLIIMYLKCFCFDDAYKIFCSLQCQTARLWHPIVAEYMEEGYDKIAIEHIMKMQDGGIEPGKTSFLALLKFSMDLHSSDIAHFVHGHVMRMGLESDKEIGNTLVNAYARLGDFDKALKVFDLLAPDTRSYRTMIANCAHQGENSYALDIYVRMQVNSLKPDDVIVAGALKVCGRVGSPSLGRLLHYCIIIDSIVLDVLKGTNLVDMYCRLGEIEDAHTVFLATPEHSVVLWSVLISGYIQHGHELIALQVYEKMQKTINPDEITLSYIIKACANLGALELGRLLNDCVIRSKLESNIVIGSILVDMYAKSASLKEACRVFESLTVRNVVTWGALIAGYALEGDFIGACQCLVNMEKQGLAPDSGIFSNLLTACSHAGFMKCGCQFFNQIHGIYNASATTRHYNCMINILGQSGCLEEAVDLLRTMPSLPEVIGLKSLLNGCKLYGNPTMGKQYFNHLAKLNSNDASVYIGSSLDLYDEHKSMEDEDYNVF